MQPTPRAHDLPHFESNIGSSVPRIDGLQKVTGRARYVDDLQPATALHATLVVSTQAHARIVSVDTQAARQMPGVRAVVTGLDYPVLIGTPLADRPLLAIDTVRYVGDVVAIIVADRLQQALAAVPCVAVVYAPYPIIQCPRQAALPAAPILHPNLANYRIERSGTYPVPGTNIASHTSIRKGGFALASATAALAACWQDCDVVIETEVSFPQAHHAALETHCATAEIFPDGRVEITASTQSPYVVPEMVAQTFGFHAADVRVHTPLVGGAFGGKSPVYIELLAVLAAKSVAGHAVHLRLSREQCMTTLPGHIGLEATIKLGAKASGELVAAAITYWFDGGGYSDRGPIVARAAATDCTGPYRVPHVWCDAFLMYTNHPPATSYRGFGHPEQTFVMERALDLLADKLAVDALQLRLQNAILPGDTTPTQAVLTDSNVGNLPQCLERLRALLEWTGPQPVATATNVGLSAPPAPPAPTAGPTVPWPSAHNSGTAQRAAPAVIRAQGICCIWKTSSSPPGVSSGALVKVERDGHVTLLTGAVEIGQGTKTGLAQMVAEIFQMSVATVHVVLDVDTAAHPEHWKTVASRTSQLAGNAAVAAARDAVWQLRQAAALVLGSDVLDVRIAHGVATAVGRTGRVIAEIPIGKLSHGYTFANGRTVGNQVIGRGSYVIEDVTPLDPATGQGQSGPEWTVAAQGVEIEFCRRDFSYRITRAVTVVDCGRVIHPDLALGQIQGGMNMGLSLASREGYVYDVAGAVTNQQLRVYPIHRYGDQPEYRVAFVETPHLQAPWGLRGIGEHGLIGMPAALANALSRATGCAVNQMPMTSELLWRTVMSK